MEDWFLDYNRVSIFRAGFMLLCIWKFWNPLLMIYLLYMSESDHYVTWFRVVHYLQTFYTVEIKHPEISTISLFFLQVHFWRVRSSYYFFLEIKIKFPSFSLLLLIWTIVSPSLDDAPSFLNHGKPKWARNLMAKSKCVHNLERAIGRSAKMRYSGHSLSPFCAHWLLFHLSM